MVLVEERETATASTAHGREAGSGDGAESGIDRSVGDRVAGGHAGLDDLLAAVDLAWWLGREDGSVASALGADPRPSHELHLGTTTTGTSRTAATRGPGMALAARRSSGAQRRRRRMGQQRRARSVTVSGAWSPMAATAPATGPVERHLGEYRSPSAPRPSAPPEAGATPRVRLTPRGRLVLAVAVLGLLVAAFALGRSSPASAVAHEVRPRHVVVAPGDTLWAIAVRVAPNADPRATIEKLRSVNHLGTRGLVAGQSLAVPAG